MAQRVSKKQLKEELIDELTFLEEQKDFLDERIGEIVNRLKDLNITKKEIREYDLEYIFVEYDYDYEPEPEVF